KTARLTESGHSILKPLFTYIQNRKQIKGILILRQGAQYLDSLAVISEAHQTDCRIMVIVFTEYLQGGPLLPVLQLFDSIHISCVYDGCMNGILHHLT
ncbi:hypothetical protein, partial [Bacteroides uniformis]|uniref:hypothetical protein n=1 Tax=Bacteroides uniformis TaxID=820 RepID=UPI00210B3F3B